MNANVLRSPLRAESEITLGIRVNPAEASKIMAGEKTYVSTEVYLTELLDRTWPPKLEGFNFTSCRIYGPMVVLELGNVTFANVRFNARNVDEMFFEVPAGAAKVGVVGLLNCTFADCEIDGVAFVGTREVRDQIEQALG